MARVPIRSEFLESHRKEAYLAFAFTIVLAAIALLPGIGYNATIEVVPRGMISGAHFSEGYSISRLCNGTLTASFNPLLYPVSHLLGSGHVFRKFQGASEFWDHEGTQLKEAALMGTLLLQVALNVPFLVACGMLTTLTVLRLARIPAIAKFLARVHTQLAQDITSEAS